jgi:hypothetical protein
MTLAGLVVSPIATASENETTSISATFPLGTSLLTNAQKTVIKKAVTTAGTDATFLVTGVAGKLPGVSDSAVQLLAKNRAQVVESYLVKLGVSKASVTIKVKITRLGIVPKTRIFGSVAAPAITATPVVSDIPAASAPSAALACASGGTCVVGDRGPGGGIVYYVSAANFTSTGSTCNTECKYLEVAPATWQSAGVSVANDGTYVWSTNTTDVTTQVLSAASPTESGFTDEQENWKIGKGFSNTSLMKATSAAQTKVLAYAGNSTAGQWFIPSMNELNELCKYARGQTTGVLTVKCFTGSGTFKSTANAGSDLGGFVEDVYRSSSERSAGNAWTQDVYNGVQGSYGKGSAAYVRPIRAFGPPCATGGTCVVGDRGPGGGIVYYVSAANFTSTGSACSTTCKYLEVAPATWQSARAIVANDLKYVWSTDPASTGQNITTLSTEGPVTNGPAEKFNWKIGQGFHNTSVMKATSTAKDAALAYAGNSTAGQWFIPSMNELNELCKYARGQTTGNPTVACDDTGTLKTGIANDLGGFTTGDYWSSSEDSAAHAAGRNFYSDPGFGGPSQFRGANKSNDYCVRPVRAF